MLTASEIVAQIERGEVAWRGELRGDGLLLRLGSPLQLLADPGHIIDLADQDSIDTLYTQALHGWDECELAPGHLALCAAVHPLRLGPDFAAAIASLSHLARVGLATHVTSPWVMPGWDGHLTLELLNTGPARLRPQRPWHPSHENLKEDHQMLASSQIAYCQVRVPGRQVSSGS